MHAVDRCCFHDNPFGNRLRLGKNGFGLPLLFLYLAFYMEFDRILHCIKKSLPAAKRRGQAA